MTEEKFLKLMNEATNPKDTFRNLVNLRKTLLDQKEWAFANRVLDEITELAERTPAPPEVEKLKAKIRKDFEDLIALSEELCVPIELPGYQQHSIWAIPGAGICHYGAYGWINSYCI